MKDTVLRIDSPTDNGHKLEQLVYANGDIQNEAWLQQMIFAHPELLPVTEFDESFSPLIPIGREVSNQSGYIDNLYISPLGQLTIVETKLWKNPERHRTVVAQIIDYAKELSNWDYDQLNKAVLKASRKTDQPGSLDQKVEPFLKEAGLTLVDFQERVIANLKMGEFLLLIVGDRISPNVALLSDAIHGAPGLDFKIGLIELHMYSLDSEKDWPILVVPDIIGRTIEKQRGTIKIQYIKEKPKVSVEIDSEKDESKATGKTTPELFLQKLPSDLESVYEYWFDIWSNKDFYIYWGSVGFSMRVKVNGKWQTIMKAYPEWALTLIRESDAHKIGAKEDDYKAYLDVVSQIPQATDILADEKKQYIKHEELTDEELMMILKATTEFAEKML